MWFIENEDSRIARINICNSCEHKKETLIVGSTCELCKCPILSKVYVRIAKCPIGKWETIGSYTRKGDYDPPK